MHNLDLNETDSYVLFGRNSVNENGIALFWTGSAMEFNIKASCLYVHIDCGYDNSELMLDIIIEGERTQKIVLEKGLHRYQVFAGMNTEMPVRVRLVRDTQCMTDEKKHYLVIKKLESDGEFVKKPEYDIQMEFIGDSLTSGEGCGLTKRAEWIPVVFDATENYAYKVAQILSARYSVLSQSGWGLYASYDADTTHNLPNFYDQICGTVNDATAINEFGAHEKWDFSNQELDFVVINLGTNDGSGMKAGKIGEKEFLAGFRKKAIGFLKTIRNHNRSCTILWVYGMLGTDMEGYIKEAIDAYKKETGDSRVEYLRLAECKGEDLGVRYHPTPAAHEKAAKNIAEHIQSLQAFFLR